MNRVEQKTITVAITGASGAAYALRLIDHLLKAEHRVYLLYSQAAQVVVNMESGIDLPAKAAEAEHKLKDYFGFQHVKEHSHSV